MKKIMTTLLLVTFLCNNSLCAADGREDQTEQEETEVMEGKQTEAPLQEIGMEEAPATKPRDDSNLKNWLFAAGSIVSATVAIIIVSLCPGSAPSSGSPPQIN